MKYFFNLIFHFHFLFISHYFVPVPHSLSENISIRINQPVISTLERNLQFTVQKPYTYNNIQKCIQQEEIRGKIKITVTLTPFGERRTRPRRERELQLVLQKVKSSLRSGIGVYLQYNRTPYSSRPLLLSAIAESSCEASGFVSMANRKNKVKP